jgi:ribonuclease P protein component
MLPRPQRVRTAAEHRLVARRGARAGRSTLSVAVLATGTGPARAGFVVPKTVGPAVVRNRMERQLRHAVRPLLAELPDGTAVVVRVRPAAADVAADQRRADLRGALTLAARRAGALADDRGPA